MSKRNCLEGYLCTNALLAVVCLDDWCFGMHFSPAYTQHNLAEYSVMYARRANQDAEAYSESTMLCIVTFSAVGLLLRSASLAE